MQTNKIIRLIIFITISFLILSISKNWRQNTRFLWRVLYHK